MKVLVTGGAGYVGSAVVHALVDAGHAPVVLDNLSAGDPDLLPDEVPVHLGDIARPGLVDELFDVHPDIAATIHCAALVSVEESTADPLGYWRTNALGSLQLLEALVRRGCRRVVFSSTAAVYAQGGGMVYETSPTMPMSAYASSKLAVEMAMMDLARARLLTDAVALRYFNVVGADPSLRCGPYKARETHLLGRLWAARAAGERLVVAGTNWPTRDGTGLRDYVHVWDVARAHVAVLARRPTGFLPINLGTGTGTTVLEMVEAFRAVAGPVRTVDGLRRPGDVAGAVASVGRARDELGWRAELTVQDAIRDELAWRRRYGNESRQGNDVGKARPAAEAGCGAG